MQEIQMSSFRNGIWVLILNGLKDVDFEWDFLDDWLRATWRPLMEMSGDLEEESVLHSQDRFPIFKEHLPCSTREREGLDGETQQKKRKKRKRERASIIKNLRSTQNKKTRKINGWFTYSWRWMLQMIFLSFYGGGTWLYRWTSRESSRVYSTCFI